MNILIGCDPEVFVKQQGLFKSAYGLIKGDKKHPQKVNRGAVQVDGMALEFNIDPAATEDEFCINVQDVLNTMKLMVPEYEVVATPVAHFSLEYIRSQPAAAIELGCDPDYDAWTGDANEKPNAERPMRTAAGHIHIGWTNNEDIHNPMHVGQALAAGKQMDFFLGLPSLIYDKCVERREMYGKAGCVRIKPYGVEYRTLSNEWLNKESLMRWVFRSAQAGMAQLIAGNSLADKYGDIRAIINNNDVEAAKKIMTMEGIEYAPI